MASSSAENESGTATTAYTCTICSRSFGVETDAEAHLFRDHDLDEYVNAIVQEVDASQYADN